MDSAAAAVGNWGLDYRSRPPSTRFSGAKPRLSPAPLAYGAAAVLSYQTAGAGLGSSRPD